MLQSLNSGLNSKILRGLFGVLLLAALLGLVMTDVGGFFRNGGFSRTDLAKVGSTELTVPQFDPLYRRQLQTAGIGPDQARTMGLPNMILQQEITRQTLLQAAQRVGITVSDSYVAKHLQKQLKFVPVAGNDKVKLQAILRSMDLSESEFVTAIKGDTSAQLLSDTISSQIKAVPTATQNAVSGAATQSRQAEIITLTQNTLPAITAPTDDQLHSFLNENKDAYQTPEQRTVTVATIAQDKLVPTVTIEDAAIQKYYADNQEQFLAPARVQFTQVIAPDEATAKTIFNTAQKDMDLETVAKAHKAQFVKQDWYDKTSLPNELSTALFAPEQMKRNGLLAPVHSSIGWHIIQTSSYQPESHKTLETVKKDISDILKQEQTDEAVNKQIEEIENQAGDGTSLDKIVEPYQGLILHADGVGKQAGQEKIAALKLPDDAQGNVVEAIFTLNEGDTSPIIESKKGTYLLVHVDKVNEPHLPEFTAVKAKLTADWTKQQQDAQLDKIVDAIIGDYDAKSPNVKTISEKHAMPYHQTGFLARDSKELPAAVQNVLFNLSPQNDLTSVKTPDGAVIVRLSGITTKAGEKITDKQAEQLRTTIAGELQQQFIMGWRDYLGVDINQPLLEKTYMKAAAKDDQN